MLKRLDELFETDRVSQWRMIFTSAAIIAAFGMIAESAHESVHQAQIEATIAGAIAFLFQVLLYCVRSERRKAPRPDLALIGRRLVMRAAVASLFIFACAIPAPLLEAAVLDRRLRALTRDPRLSDRKAVELADALSAAATASVPLPRTTLIRVRDVLRDATENQSAIATLPKTVDALVAYSHVISEKDEKNAPADARAAYTGGLDHKINYVIAGRDRGEADAAVKAFSRAVELSRGDTVFRADVLLSRSALYVALGEWERGLADAAEAERLGSLDMSQIMYVESAALVSHGRPEDLRRAVELLTVGMRMTPPAWALFAEGAPLRVYRTEMRGRRAQAYYLLGEYSKAIQDSQQALQYKVGLYAWRLYAIMTASYLQLGNAPEASRTISEWEAITGDASLALMRQSVESDIPELQRAVIRQLEPFIRGVLRFRPN